MKLHQNGVRDIGHGFFVDIEEMCKKSRSYAELCGRTTCHLQDVQVALVDFNSHANLLRHFMLTMKDMTPSLGK
jgi:hypothetical protein